MCPPTKKNKTVQWCPHINRGQFLKRTDNNLLIRCTDPRGTNSKTIRMVNALLPRLLSLNQLSCALRNSHVARGFKDATTTSQILHGLFLDLDIEKHKCVQADLSVFADLVVEGGWLPVFREEDHADSLAEVIELEACAADSGHDGGIGDDVCLNA